MTAQTILGIDPGAHGALAVLDEGENLLEVFDMPSPTQPVEANVNIFDQMTDDEQNILLAAMAAIRAAEEDRPEAVN